jgi:hypothetical protein
MVCKIIFDKKKKQSYQQYESDMEDFFDISGRIDFVDNLSVISCNTEFLIRDVFALFYSINDFIEFGFVAISIGDNLTFEIENRENSTTFIKINDKIIEVEIKSFLSSILKNAYDFFYFFNQLKENQEYQMYLRIIYSLYMRYIPERIKEIGGRQKNYSPLIEERIKRGKMLGGHILLDPD